MKSLQQATSSQQDDACVPETYLQGWKTMLNSSCESVFRSVKALSNGIDVKAAERQADADFRAHAWLPVQYLDSTLPASMITRYYRPERHTVQEDRIYELSECFSYTLRRAPT